MKPLEGIKVVEFATYVVVPAAARVLADWGAEVIKIEAATGDPWRIQGRAYKLPIRPDCNPLYAVTNSGKRYVSLDVKKPEGKEALLKILETADVFMTNVRWGAIERLGLDWETLHEKFPKLVYFHFTGAGYDGPRNDRPGYDGTSFWAASGAYHDLHEPGMRPPPMITSFGDVTSSNSAVSGILAALMSRTRTGEGMRVTSSLYANGIWCNQSNIVGMQERDDGSAAPMMPRKDEDASNPYSHIYECSDGKWITVLGSFAFRKSSEKVMKAFGLDEYLQDPRYNTIPLSSPENARVLYKICIEKFKQKTSEEWDEILTAADVSCQIIEHSRDVTKSEQAWANEYFTRMTCPDGNSYAVPNSPVDFFGVEKSHTRHAGFTGCNTTEVLTEYGYTAEQIQNMMDSGAAAGV